MAEILHNHNHTETPLPPERPLDSGSQALSEALSSSFGIIKVLMVVLVIVFFGSGIFIVGPDERAIKLRFGRVVGQGADVLLREGLHWSMPYPLEEVRKVSVTGIKTVTSSVGWYATTPEQELSGFEPPAGPTLNPAVDSYVLTGDENILHSRATLSYRISDPIAYVFDFVNASNEVQSALDTALLHAAAQYAVDDVLTRDVLGFRETVRKAVIKLLDERGIGVTVEQCDVRSVPPRQLKDAFANVLRAEVNRSKVLNDAHGLEIQVLSKASADSSSRTNTAASERARLVTEVASRAEQFQELLPKYRQNPNLFVQQRLMEVLGRSFTNVQDKFFIAQNPDGKPKELRLLLNREPPKKPEENK